VVSNHTGKRGPFDDASKKKNDVDDVVVTCNGQGLARLSPMSQLEPDAGHHQETVER
jgi:hypothetical protein